MPQIERVAMERCSQHDGAHDALHVRRVVHNARALLKAEGRRGVKANEPVVLAACWLHDIVQVPKGSGPKGEAARRSAAEARQLLADLGVRSTATDAVASAIETHSFSGGLKPATIEAAIVQDADRLDALGAIGVARLWMSAATLGSAMYDLDDPLGRDRALDDRAFGVDHIEAKLLTLPSLMNTESARTEAERRGRYVLEHRAELLRELSIDTFGENDE